MLYYRYITHILKKTNKPKTNKPEAGRRLTYGRWLELVVCMYLVLAQRKHTRTSHLVTWYRYARKREYEYESTVATVAMIVAVAGSAVL